MRARSVATVSLTVLAVLMTVVGCGGHVGGVAVPTPAQAARTSTDDGMMHTPTSAPKVTDPLDARKFVDQPCSALANGDLAELAMGGAKTVPSVVAGNPVCQWQMFSAGSSDAVSWVTSQRTGLASVYAQGSLKGGYFVPTVVDGYPGVYQSDADLRSSGACGLSVGISDTLYFDVLYQFTTDHDSQQYAKESCSLAERTASDVIKNLRNNGG